MKGIVFAAALAAICPALLRAQESLPLLLALPASTRALALGNAYPLGTVDPDAVFYNPALIDAARGFNASWTSFGASTQLGLSAGIEWWKGSIGLGLQSLSYGRNVPETSDAQGPPTSPLPTTTAQVGTVAFGRSFFGFRTGIAGKLVDQRYLSDRDVTFAADVGIARNVGRFVFGIAGRNWGPDPDLATAAELPSNITLAGASRSTPIGPLDMTVAASGSWLRGGTWAAGGGVEASYWPIPGRTFSARAGFRWIEDSDVAPLTLGAGFTGDRIGIDYAFENVDGADAVHRVTLRWR